MAKGNARVTVRAARTIKAGEELTIQYKDPLIGNVLSAASFKNHWLEKLKNKSRFSQLRSVP